MLNYDRVPNINQRDEVKNYIELGQPMGDFLTAIFRNDLSGAAQYADETNRALLWQWGVFLFNEAPIGCHGSMDAVGRWISKGGLYGQERANRAHDRGNR